MDLHPSFSYYFIFVSLLEKVGEWLFEPIKRPAFYDVKMEKSGWEDFSPELNRKGPVGFFGYLLGISVVVMCFFIS